MQTPTAGLILRALMICLPLTFSACDSDRTNSTDRDSTSDTGSTQPESLPTSVPTSAHTSPPVPGTAPVALPGIVPVSDLPNLPGRLTSVQAGNSAISFLEGLAPFSIDPFEITIQKTDEDTNLINGGSTVVSINSDVPFNSVYVAAWEGITSNPHYYKVLLPATVTRTDLTLTLEPESHSALVLPWLMIKTGAPTGHISYAEFLSFDSEPARSDDLRVSVNRTQDTDRDQFMVEPGGPGIGNSRPAGL